MMLVPHRERTYVPPRPVTKTALHLYMKMMFVPQKKNTYRPPQSVAGVGLLL
jgi:hypothetical protein